MSNKTNTKTNIKDSVNETVLNAGLILMAAAATAGIIEMPDQFEKRAILAKTPTYAFAGPVQGGDDSAQRRERDESGPHYISYGVTQRTPSRAGRR
jgi:hypothetical protein